MQRSEAASACGRFLLVETAALFGAARAGALMAGAALELVHCYSLVHDDLPAMDDDDLRRGRPTVHKAFDEATAILAGDALLTLAFDVMARPEVHADPAVRIALVAELARASGLGGMAGGQMLDLAAEGRFEPKRALERKRDRNAASDEDRRADPLRLQRRRNPRTGRRCRARQHRPLWHRDRPGVPDRRRSARRRRRCQDARQSCRQGCRGRQGDAGCRAWDSTGRARVSKSWSRKPMLRWRRSARKPILCAPPPVSSPSERPDERKDAPVARKICRSTHHCRSASRRLHARLLISIAVGMAVTLGLAMTDWSMATKLLLGWDIGVVALSGVDLSVDDGARRRTRSAAAPRSTTKVRLHLLILTDRRRACEPGRDRRSQLGGAKQAPRSHAAGLRVALAMATILLSWAFVHTIFALHYAHEYYGERGDDAIGGLTFPGRRQAGLLGLSLFLARHRHDLAGLGRRDHQQGHPPHRDGSRRAVVLLQCRRVRLTVNIVSNLI